jgi:hypothetical protein
MTILVCPARASGKKRNHCNRFSSLMKPDRNKK